MRKGLFFALLAFAMPFFASAQIEVNTDYYPYYVGQTSAVFSGDIEFTGEDTVEVMFHYGVSGGPLDQISPSLFIDLQDEDIDIKIFVSGLIPDTDYDYAMCALATDGFPGLTCGITQDFETDEADLDNPGVYTSYPTAEGSTFATLICEVYDFGGYGEVDAYIKLGQDPTFLDIISEHVLVEEPYGEFEVDVTGLQPERLYYFQACASNPSGTYCGPVEYFNTLSKSVIDLEIQDFEQVGTCSFEIEFDSPGMSDHPSPANGTVKVGNPTGVSFYTQEFTFYEEQDKSIVIDYYDLVLAGIELDDDMTVIQVKVESGGVSGKVTGKYMFDGEDCEEEVGLTGDIFGRIASDESINIFPNPATDMISVQNKESGTLNLFDVAGRFIKGYQVDVGFTEIHVDFLTAGAYFFEFTNSEGEKTTQKIIKQ
ncbi:MAG: T9SS type A sorting domain-containing protein [Candidatus Pacebacteria bacterium]|nr:T9SS type A sorting domain-containing protein [Candidatus Paceibacterota bacterium]MBP9772283.1 T9SS type A sorting domain-containing protein [Candidatus Paceibacterota bacterium]